MSTPSERLVFATDMVRRAGAMMMERVDDDFRVDKKGTIDLVTEVDLAVERMFRAAVADRFPADEVLAEEMGGRDSVPEGACWVFDPIDGTTNFAHGIPIFCASLALEVGGVAQVGAVYDPTRDELFTAVRGGGAFLNGRPLRVSTSAAIGDAVLATGFPYNVHDRVEEVVSLFGAFVGRARAVRRLGAAAIDLCYVAAGRMDAFWESDLKPWDIAAGCLILTEAGGQVSGLAGQPYTSRGRGLMATNGLLHEPMVAIVRSHQRTA